MNQRFSITPSNAATDQRLSDSVHRTLTVIGIFGDKNGWCWPSQSTLAELRGVSRKTINLHVKELISLEYINISPRYDEETGAQKSNMMQIKFDFTPDVTGGVTSKGLQGGGSPEGYRGGETQEVTHNDLSNAPKERPIREYINDGIATDSQIKPIIDALSKVAKERYVNGRVSKYEDVALTIFSMGATPEKVIQFGDWWKNNCWYSPPTKAALTTIADEWDNFTSGKSLNQSSWGKSPPKNGTTKTRDEIIDDALANMEGF